MSNTTEAPSPCDVMSGLAPLRANSGAVTAFSLNHVTARFVVPSGVVFVVQATRVSRRAAS
jgi:hypothetical protein